MKNLFVINPLAGKGKKAEKFVSDIETYCSLNNIDYEIYKTKGTNDVVPFLKNYLSKNEEVNVFACGGDGTFNDVINGAYGFDAVRIGIFPLGSGNDYVRNFTNKPNFLSIQNQLDGETFVSDLIKCKDAYAISQCSVGLDARACAKQVDFKKLPFVSGEFAFMLSTLYCLVNKTDNRFKLTVDGEERETEKLILGVAANARYYGGGFKCAPKALTNDGYIDLVTVKDRDNLLKLIKLLPLYKKGKHEGLDIVKIERCKKVTVETMDETDINVDGECYKDKKFTFEIVPKAIKVIIPKGSRIITE